MSRRLCFHMVLVFFSSLTQFACKLSPSSSQPIASLPEQPSAPPLSPSDKAYGTSLNLPLPSQRVASDAFKGLGDVWIVRPTDNELVSYEAEPFLEKTYWHNMTQLFSTRKTAQDLIALLQHPDQSPLHTHRTYACWIAAQTHVKPSAAFTAGVGLQLAALPPKDTFEHINLLQSLPRPSRWSLALQKVCPSMDPPKKDGPFITFQPQSQTLTPQNAALFIAALASLSSPEGGSQQGASQQALWTQWGFLKQQKFYSPHHPDAQVWLWEHKDFALILAAARPESWEGLLDFAMASGEWLDAPEGRILGVFLAQAQSFWELLAHNASWFWQLQKPIFVAGYDQGVDLGGLIALKAYQTQVLKTFPQVYLFGAPKFGNEAFAQHFQKMVQGRWWRIAGEGDFLPQMPPGAVAAPFIENSVDDFVRRRYLDTLPDERYSPGQSR